jgi:hypothetical protein
MYRKRERAHELGVFSRFRYNDLKEAACGCVQVPLWEVTAATPPEREAHS